MADRNYGRRCTSSTNSVGSFEMRQGIYITLTEEPFTRYIYLDVRKQLEGHSHDAVNHVIHAGTKRVQISESMTVYEFFELIGRTVDDVMDNAKLEQ
ncbi:MAG: hypothetical protein WC533_02730 [Candidatus Pacearchaeota archaeon]